MIVALTSLFGEAGGIQAFNRLLCHAAWEWTRDRDLPLVVLAMMDAPDAVVDTAVLPFRGDGRGRYRAFGGDRRRFSAAVWATLATIRPAPRLCLAHVNIAALGLPAELARRLHAARGFGVVAHGTDVWTPLSMLRREALRRAQVVGCVSDDTAQKVRAVQGVAAGRTLRVINALDPWRFPLPNLRAAAPEIHDGERRPVRVLSVTRLSAAEPKGIDLVLRALPSLSHLEYTVVGAGTDRPRLEALASDLGVAGRVRFLGSVDDERRAAELRRCDIFALPSAGEGFGIVYLEAMAYRKPCLAASVGGAPEVVRDGETGLVVAARVDAVARGLGALCANGAWRSRLGAAGYARLISTYTYPQFRSAAAAFFARL